MNSEAEKIAALEAKVQRRSDAYRDATAAGDAMVAAHAAGERIDFIALTKVRGEIDTSWRELVEARLEHAMACIVALAGVVDRLETKVTQ